MAGRGKRLDPEHGAVDQQAAHTWFCDWQMLPLRRWSPARRALPGVEGRGVLSAVAGALEPFLGAHLGEADGCVSDALETNDALSAGEPDRLFALVS